MPASISIVIPTRGRPRFLDEAVRSALAQEGVSLEVIVVHDGPADEPGARAAPFDDPRVRVTATGSSGGRSGAVRNAGARHATAPYLHFLDDDDVLEPGGLAALVADLEARPEVDVAYGAIVPFGGTAPELEAERAYWQRAACAARLTRGPLALTAQMLFREAILACSACVIRRQAFEELGGFDEAMTAFVDGELYLRAIRRHGAVYHEAPVVRRRIGHLAVTRGPDGQQRYGLAYRQAQAKYGREHGRAELVLLRLLAVALGWRPADPYAHRPRVGAGG